MYRQTMEFHIQERFVFDVLFILNSNEEQRGPHKSSVPSKVGALVFVLNAHMGNFNKTSTNSTNNELKTLSLCTLALLSIVAIKPMDCALLFCPLTAWVAQLLDAACACY